MNVTYIFPPWTRSHLGYVFFMRNIPLPLSLCQLWFSRVAKWITFDDRWNEKHKLLMLIMFKDFKFCLRIFMLSSTCKFMFHHWVQLKIIFGWLLKFFQFFEKCIIQRLIIHSLIYVSNLIGVPGEIHCKYSSENYFIALKWDILFVSIIIVSNIY